MFRDRSNMKRISTYCADCSYQLTNKAPIGTTRKTTVARKWTPERDAKLAEMWAKGMLAEDIGCRLGCSSNAINLRRYKLGLPARFPKSKPLTEEGSVTRLVTGSDIPFWGS